MSKDFDTSDLENLLDDAGYTVLTQTFRNGRSCPLVRIVGSAGVLDLGLLLGSTCKGTSPETEVCHALNAIAEVATFFNADTGYVDVWWPHFLHELPEDDRDPDHERAAAQSRSCDFADNAGKDWT